MLSDAVRLEFKSIITSVYHSHLSALHCTENACAVRGVEEAGELD